MKNIVYSLFIFSFSFLIFSCERLENADGPTYSNSTGDVGFVEDFNIIKRKSGIDFPATTVQFSSVENEDFISDSVYFTAELEDEVNWLVTLEGSSGAKKMFTGVSTTINVLWLGESDNIAFFSPGENVAVTLSFFGNDQKIEKSILLQQPKLFNDVVLVSDFETTILQGLVKATDDDPDGWFQFFDEEGTNEAITYGVFPDIITINPGLAKPMVTPIQGNGYFHLRGKDNASTAGSFFIGGIGHDPILFGLPDGIDASEVYINFYANPNGNKTTKLIVELAGIGGDLFTREIIVDWDGWRQVSIRLSDFALKAAGEAGIGQLKIPQLKSTRFVIHSANIAGNIAEINLDYVTFTVGKPFKQQ